MQDHHREALANHVRNLDDEHRERVQSHVDAFADHLKENDHLDDKDHEKHASYIALAKWGAAIVGIPVTAGLGWKVIKVIKNHL